MRLPFGQHRGEELENVDESYLCWLLESVELRPSLRRAIERQLGMDETGSGDSAAVVLPRIVFEWQQEMRSRFTHDADLAVIAEGFELLRQLCSSVTGREWPDDVAEDRPEPEPSERTCVIH